jgi:hypothetical protein
VRDACIEFCKESLIWQEPIDPIDSIEGEAVYELDVPTGTNLTHVVDLYYNLARLAKKSVSEIAARYSRDWMQYSGTPAMFTMLNPNEVTLVPKPDRRWRCVDRDSRLCADAQITQIIDYIYEDYAEEIARGAASEAMAIRTSVGDLKMALGYAGGFCPTVRTSRMNQDRRERRFQSPSQVLVMTAAVYNITLEQGRRFASRNSNSGLACRCQRRCGPRRQRNQQIDVGRTAPAASSGCRCASQEADSRGNLHITSEDTDGGITACRRQCRLRLCRTKTDAVAKDGY